MRKTTLLVLIICSILIKAADNLIIDGVNYAVDTLANYKVGPGTQYYSLRLQSTKRLDVFFLKVDLNNPHISFKSVLGRDSIYTGEQPSAMAKRKSQAGAVYFAGTNGDFYATTGYVGLPIGCTMIDGQIATPPTGNWKSIAFDEQNVPGIGILTYGIKVLKGSETWTVNRVNHLREANQLVFFNQHNGKGTRTNAFGTEVLIQLNEGEGWGVNKLMKCKVVKIEANKGNMAVPTGFAVLSGHGTAQTLLNSLALNDELNIEITMKLDGSVSSYSNIIGGESRAPMLKNGVVEQTDIWNELHPRTGVGYSQDKKTIIFCVVDGRGASAGVTTKQLAQIIQSASAYTAFNMDGGGSSCMYVKDFGPMNVPSDGTERAVANGLFAVSSAPTDNTITEIKPYNSTIKLPKFGVFIPKFLAYNQYGVLINKDLQNVVLSCNAEVGHIATDGRFVASGAQGGIVTARYNNVETQFKIELIGSAQVAFRLDSVLIDHRREYPIQVQSVIGLNTIEVLPAALAWIAVDPTVCSVENGILKGLKNGTTYVFGTLGEFKDSIKVNVEIPLEGKLIIDTFNPENWTMDASSALNATLNNQNLPGNWTAGGAVNYVYNSTRAPYIKLIRNLTLYSLPDTLKVTLNLGEITLTKLILSLKANNAASDVTKEFTAIPQNADATISIPLGSLFNVIDIAIYPVRLNYLNFYLGTQNINQAYTLALKDISLHYKGFSISATNSLTAAGISVFPNPAKNHELTIRLDKQFTGIFKVDIYNALGQLVFTNKYKNHCKNEFALPVESLKPGTYLVKTTYENQQYSTKFFIQ
ncbi:MAG: phosphodiester glycosidase family protein [Paludibacter sp.]|nr:phosphodiester glycosidase family protein [Paludibacter sp.]